MRKISENIILRKFKSEYFLLDSSNEKLHSFNETGNFIFDMWFKGKSKEEIAEEMTREYEIDKNKAIKDTEDFISDLEKRKII